MSKGKKPSRKAMAMALERMTEALIESAQMREQAVKLAEQAQADAARAMNIARQAHAARLYAEVQRDEALSAIALLSRRRGMVS